MLAGELAKLLALPLKRSLKQGREEADDLEAMIANLSPAQKELYLKEYELQKKSIFTGYLFWMTGLHYAYTGQWIRLVFFLGTLGGIFYWWAIDGLLMFHVIGKYNRKISKEIIFNLPDENPVKVPIVQNAQTTKAAGMIASAHARFAERAGASDQPM